MLDEVSISEAPEGLNGSQTRPKHLLLMVAHLPLAEGLLNMSSLDCRLQTSVCCFNQSCMQEPLNASPDLCLQG